MDKETFDKGLAIRRQVLGDEYVDKALADVTDPPEIGAIGRLESPIATSTAPTGNPRRCAAIWPMIV